VHPAARDWSCLTVLLSTRFRARTTIIVSAWLTATLAGCTAATPATTVPAAAATSAAHPAAARPAAVRPPATISARAFGMHYLDTSHPYPPLPFGTARVWDMGVTWMDLQPTSAAWSPAALARLDSIVATFRAHGAQPVITLGMTPTWAAGSCRYVVLNVDWGRKTCAPRSTSATGPWGAYVRMLAKRYSGKVRYFELWNEPSLRNGYNDSIAKLAQMQAVARPIVHQYGAQLLSPSVPLHDGSNGTKFLDRFLSLAGGKAFDVVNLHLYSAIQIAKANYGPEWTMGQLSAARKVLARHGVANRPVWNTEVNVGNQFAHVNFTGTAGAAQITRTFILNIENRVARTIWYAADVRTWAGTVLVKSDYRTPTVAGSAYRMLRNRLVGGRAYGCSRTVVGTIDWRYVCRFHLATGRNMLAVWTTGRAFAFHAPAGTRRLLSVTGSALSARPGRVITVGRTPIYVIGTFGV
jgi:hypothetical protein